MSIRKSVQGRINTAAVDVDLLGELRIAVFLCIHHSQHGLKNPQISCLLCRHIRCVKHKAQIRNAVGIYLVIDEGNVLYCSFFVVKWLYLLFDIGKLQKRNGFQFFFGGRSFLKGPKFLRLFYQFCNLLFR